MGVDDLTVAVAPGRTPRLQTPHLAHLVWLTVSVCLVQLANTIDASVSSTCPVGGCISASTMEVLECRAPQLIERTKTGLVPDISRAPSETHSLNDGLEGVCAEYCRHTFGCMFFSTGFGECKTFSTCDGGQTLPKPVTVRRIPELPHRCQWDTVPTLQRQVAQALAAVSMEGPELQARLVNVGLDLAHSPTFAECPVGGAAVRMLHVWAAASYHHGLQPSLAFATEHLDFRPELRFVLDVDWVEILKSPWAGVFFGVLSRIADSFCQRLNMKVNGSVADTCESVAQKTVVDCNLTLAGRTLSKSIASAQRHVVGCAPNGRLSELLRRKHAKKLFSALAKRARGGKGGRASDKGCDEDSTSSMVVDLELGPLRAHSMAVREEVVRNDTAALVLAASLRRPTSGSSATWLELLVFIERLRPVGLPSGFFNEITENRCEMDFASHFHRAFCLLPGPRIVAAAMISGLLVHPPYGPASWACTLPDDLATLQVNKRTVHLQLLDPSLWDSPLKLHVVLPAKLPPGDVLRPAYDLVACPQPLYRLEAHADRVRDWLAYHHRLGIEHWTIYDLDGSGESIISEEDGNITLVTRLPERLGSDRLKAGNAWNPICLESLAQTQCLWKYRGRAKWVTSLHSFDEYLVSERHAGKGLANFKASVLAKSERSERPPSVIRLPAVDYGGRPVEGVPVDAPMVARFLRHTGKLFWHIVFADPAAVIGINTTSATPRRPCASIVLQHFAPHDLRVNHYVDAVGARDDPGSGAAKASRFTYADTPEMLSWVLSWLGSHREKRRSSVQEWARKVALPLVAAARQAAHVSATDRHLPQNDSLFTDLSGAGLAPVARVALGLSGEAEALLVRETLQSAFAAGDIDGDSVLDATEFTALVLPSGWDEQLRRRDLHALGIYLHVWLAEDSDWDASKLRVALDAAPSDGRVQLSEFIEGIIRFCWRREARAAIDFLAMGATPLGESTSPSISKATRVDRSIAEPPRGIESEKQQVSTPPAKKHRKKKRSMS